MSVLTATVIGTLYLVDADIIFKQDLNIHDVDLVTTNKDYFIFNHTKGKVYFYKQ